MPATASPAISGIPTFAHAIGNIGKHNRKMPYVPSFNSTPANNTLPAVGASTCASGNHVWSGKTGTFTMKPTLIARNSATCTPTPNRCSGSANQCASAGIEVGTARPREEVINTSATSPTSVTKLPTNVYKKNFTAAYRRCGPPQMPIKKNNG